MLFELVCQNIFGTDCTCPADLFIMDKMLEKKFIISNNFRSVYS